MKNMLNFCLQLFLVPLLGFPIFGIMLEDHFRNTFMELAQYAICN